MPDIGTLFFLVVAVVIFLRLRSVLGTRTGNERPPEHYRDRFGGEQPQDDGDSTADNVISLPTRNQNNERIDGKDEFAEIDEVAEKGTEINDGLRAIFARDSNFTPKQFIQGGRMAYEMIVLAFADGDRKTLQNLLARDVYEGFSEALDAREEAGETVKSSFVGIDNLTIVGAEVKDNEALITLKIISEIISATFDQDGALIDGDENTVAEVKDYWTFARDLKSRDPNWKLVATEAEN